MKIDEVNQIRIAGFLVGIRGLKHVISELAEEYVERPDEEVKEALLARLSKSNYVPKSVEGDYGEAFLREFRKSLGQPYKEDDGKRNLEIKVLGPGCAQCDRLEQELMQVMSENGILAEIEHVRDIKEIGKFGVLGTPALLINGQVKSVGKVPLKSKLIKWLKEAEEECIGCK